MAHTQLNADSSRSHTAFVISVYAMSDGAMADAAPAGIVNRATGQPAEGCSLWSRISVVDLAGAFLPCMLRLRESDPCGPHPPRLQDPSALLARASKASASRRRRQSTTASWSS